MNGKELIKALDALVAEKNISPDVVFEARHRQKGVESLQGSEFEV